MKKIFTESTTFPWSAICPWSLIVKSNKSWCLSRRKEYLEDPAIKEVEEFYKNKLMEVCDLSEFIKILCECKKKRVFKKYNVKTFNHITFLALSWLNTQRAEPLNPTFFATIRGLSEHLAAGTSEDYQILELLWVGIPPRNGEKTPAGISKGVSNTNNRWQVIKNDQIQVVATHTIIYKHYPVEKLGGPKLELPLHIKNNSSEITKLKSQIKKLGSIFRAKEYFENRLSEKLDSPSVHVMNMTRSEAIIIEDDEAQTEEIIGNLQEAFPRMHIHWTDQIGKAEEIFKKKKIDLIIIDEAVQDQKATDWLLHTDLGDTKVVLITGYASMELERMVKEKLPKIQFQIKPLHINSIKL
jgi:hypothetical protein